MHQRLGLPADDYYARLDARGMAELKSLLGDINNIFTLKICLSFAAWLAGTFQLGDAECDAIRESILRNPPNANGYDIEINDPISVIAEVKCNVPINGGAVYGSAQRSGIVRDITALMTGKSKSRMDPARCLKFLVLLDTPEIRSATQQLVRTLKQHGEAIVTLEAGMRPDSMEKLYVVYVAAG